MARDSRTTTDAVAAAIARRPEYLRLLEHVADLELPDCWIGAGFVRNAIWDDLHDLEATPLSDIDVIYFDPTQTEAAVDEALEEILRDAAPDAPWSVRNQARMHLRNGDEPYQSTADALVRWPETCTAVAVRLRCGRLEVLAPFGVGDLFGLIVRPTPHFISKLNICKARIKEKCWRERWPSLRVVGLS